MPFFIIRTSVIASAIITIGIIRSPQQIRAPKNMTINLIIFSKIILKMFSQNEGALSMIGPDMNLAGENMSTNSFDIFYVSQKGCDPILNLTLNKKGMYNRYTCYKRFPNQCDDIGLEEYTKLKTAYDEWMKLMKECPCEYEPRPSHIPDSWLTPDPQGRNKRNIYPSKLGLRHKDKLVYGCENATRVASGDLFLNLKEVEIKIERQNKCCNVSHSRSKRQLHSKSADILWDMPVHYTVETNYYYDLSDWNEIIEEGLELISTKTCITFEKVALDSTKKHILFVPYSGGCGTQLGANGYLGVEHKIYLNPVKCSEAGIVSHEVMHALGFEHEMIRVDRNKSVWINFEDIPDNFKEQYYRLSSSIQYEQPYDYGSVMHYEPIFPGYEKFSIIALFRDYQSTMGQIEDISFKDAKLLNRVYCTNTNPHKAVYADCVPYEYELNNGKCKNGGYPDPINECKCRCPKGHSGDDCTSYKFKNCKVNGLKATLKKKYLTIKNASNECFWVIKDNVQDLVKFPYKFIYVNIEKLESYNCTYQCEENYIEIKYNKDKTAAGARICCGDRMMPIVIIAEAITEVLIMKHGIGKAVISYQIEHKTSVNATTCKNVGDSILDMKTHPGKTIINYGTGDEAKPIYGPIWALICDQERKLIVNGHYNVKKWECIIEYGKFCLHNGMEKTCQPFEIGRVCGFHLEIYCKKVEGSDKANWYWESPKDGWILVNSISCHPEKDTEKDKK